MKILISPAKSLDFENNVETSISSKPIFADQAHKINNTIKNFLNIKKKQLFHSQ